jgi:hypothetical protein
MYLLWLKYNISQVLFLKVVLIMNLTIQKSSSTMLRILIPVKSPRVPPSKKKNTIILVFN